MKTIFHTKIIERFLFSDLPQVNDYNVLFIDNPVGAGFSYAANSGAYATNNAQIAADLLTCIKSFYNKLPQFNKVPVYIMSQSYGGKMAVEFALVWHEMSYQPS